MDQSQYPISALIAFTITILMFYLPFSSFIPWQRSLINLCVNTIKIILKVWYLTTQTCNNFLLWLQICEIFLAENFQLRQQSNSFSFNFFFFSMLLLFLTLNISSNDAKYFYMFKCQNLLQKHDCGHCNCY